VIRDFVSAAFTQPTVSLYKIPLKTKKKTTCELFHINKTNNIICFFPLQAAISTYGRWWRWGL
jgi:hypothetical protein